MRIINLGILAHVDAGKTTTVEHLLHRCGEIKAVGSVEKGTTHTDWLPVEQERGISVKASSTILHYGDIQINLIDTPGHTDFIGEVERALHVIDAAVIIVSALEGIQPQTEVFWKALRANNIPTIIFVNKVDRMGCNLDTTLAAIHKELTENTIPLNTIRLAGCRDCTAVEAPLGENEIFILSQFDERIGQYFLENTPIRDDDAAAAIIRLTAEGLVFPLVYGAASFGEGVQCLLDSIVRFLPKTDIIPNGDVSGTIYKIEHDRALGKIAHVRMFRGSVHNRDQVKLNRQDDEPYLGKVTQIKKITGRKFVDADSVYGGDIAALCGLTDAKTGDIIGERIVKRNYKITAPLFSVRITHNNGNISELINALSELSDEDPLLDLLWNDDEKELTVKVMGTIQIEIMHFLLKQRYNLDAVFSPPTVIYKETPIKKGTGFESYTMPKPCWAIVELDIEPLARGTGLIYESIVRDSDILPRYQNHIRTSVADALRQGLYNWETTDLKVTLVGGEHHLLHTHPMDFFLATPMAVMNGLVSCGTQLLEPMIIMEITASEEFAGKIIGDIVSMRGEFDTPVMRNGKMSIEAVVPVASSIDYPVRLSSATSGRGTIRTRFHGYRECPLEHGAVAKRRGVNPLDRAKWILKMRNALT